MAKPSQTDIEVAKRTYRVHGAVGPKAVVPQVVRQYALPHHSILDYGAGPLAEHAIALKGEGYNVVAHDYHPPDENIADKTVFDPEALKRRYHIVYASNVLNVQNSPAALAATLNDLAHTVNPADGMAIVNLPSEPRKDAYRGMTLMQGAEKLEAALKRRFEHVERHTSGNNRSPVWILKKPKHYPKTPKPE